MVCARMSACVCARAWECVRAEPQQSYVCGAGSGSTREHAANDLFEIQPILAQPTIDKYKIPACCEPQNIMPFSVWVGWDACQMLIVNPRILVLHSEWTIAADTETASVLENRLQQRDRHNEKHNLYWRTVAL